MCKVFKKRLGIIFCLLLGSVMPLAAQEPAADSVIEDSSGINGVGAASPISGEYVAQERPVICNSSAPSREQWEHVVSDKAYGYKDKQEFAKKEEPLEDSGWIKALSWLASFLSSAAGKLLLWGVLLLIVGYVVYRIVRGQAGGLFAARDRRQDTADEGVLSEQSLAEHDWESHMQEALQSGNMRAAIRYAYLRLLQLLQEHGHITYRPDKTNIEYYRELADKPQRQAFRAVTRQYEWAWYGNYTPGQEAMDDYLKTFRQLKQSLSGT
jgi:hypothetical protein